LPEEGNLGKKEEVAGLENIEKEREAL